jgi:hypothetical protein
VSAAEATRPGRAPWLLLIYRLPVRTGLKATIRRRLIAIGAVYPASAVAALPASPAAERALRRLRSMIGEAGGSAQVLRAEAIDGEPDLIATYNAAREQEYEKIIAECSDIVAGIEAMAAASHFGYAELGEKDAELKSLSMRNETIRTRDILGATNAETALSSLARCRTVLDDFAQCVYQADPVSITGRCPGTQGSRGTFRARDPD